MAHLDPSRRTPGPSPTRGARPIEGRRSPAGRTGRVLTLAVATLLIGCAKERDPVTANHVFAPDDATASLELTDAKRAEAIEAMRAALAGMPAEQPTAARDGVRWSDVWIAVYWSIADFEMAILTVSERTDARMVFQLETARDEPATLVVERVEPPECIRATASIGTFGQHVETARALEVAFRRTLEAFGRKPGFD